MVNLIYHREKNIYYLQGAKFPLKPGEHIICASCDPWNELHPIAAWLQASAERVNTVKRKTNGKV